MKKTKRMKKFVACVLSVLMLVTLLPSGAALAEDTPAAEDTQQTETVQQDTNKPAQLVVENTSSEQVGDWKIDTTRKVSLTVKCAVDGKAVAGVEYKLYKAADVSEDVKFTLVDPFDKYSEFVNLKNLDTEGWAAAAKTLAGYVKDDGIEPLKTAVTGEDGYAKFEDLSVGLYLVIGDKFEVGKHAYEQTPFVICLPHGMSKEFPLKTSNKDFQWNYDPVVLAKAAMITSKGEIVKVWRNDNENYRPESIKVALLKDGERVEELTLTKEGNWRLDMDNLSDMHVWEVVELDVPRGYTVTSVVQNGVFTVTNTVPSSDDPPYNPPRHEEEIPNDPVPEGEPDITIPDENVPQGDITIPGVEVEIPEEPVPQAAKLPQTGLLWWPVPILAALGMVCFAIGWVKQQRSL